jgi:hypothetical protein
MSRITLTCVMGLLALPLLLAQDKEAKPEKIEVRVLSILASEHHAEVHKKLTRFAEEIQKTEPKLTGFKLNKTDIRSLPLGETTKFELPGGEVLEVTPNKPKDENGRITLTVKPPKLTPVTYECVCEKYVALATQQHVGKGKEEERLFIAVSAKPCGLKKKD